MTLEIANDYGNYDLGRRLPPPGYEFVQGERLQSICKKLRIDFAPAVIEFRKTKYGSSPVFGGVVVRAGSAPELRRAIEERKARKRAKRRREEERKQPPGVPDLSPWITNTVREVMGIADPDWPTLLADALEDAGLSDPRVLGHLRDGKSHSRRRDGCWVWRAVREALDRSC